MLLSTTPTIDGRRILEYKGVVTGETIVGANVLCVTFSAVVAVHTRKCCVTRKSLPCARWKNVLQNLEPMPLWALTLTMRR